MFDILIELVNRVVFENTITEIKYVLLEMKREVISQSFTSS